MLYSWNLAGAVMVSVGGRLADIFGRRYFMLAAPLISCIGALIGATGQNIGQMIASGVFFGIGGGLGEMAPGAVQEFVPNRWRVQVLGKNLTYLFKTKF
jgi:MFS family permease